MNARPHHTALADWLANPEPIERLSDLAGLWRDTEVTLIVAPVATCAAGFGAHLRRSFLGALGAGASPAARAGRPCSWDPPCALDVFLREQLRSGGDGLPKPYVLTWRQQGAVLAVTLRVFGTARDWFPAAAEALAAGLTGILPWTQAITDQRTPPMIHSRLLESPMPIRALPTGPLVLRFESPMDDSGANPRETRDLGSRVLSRAVRRIDALARWQGVALTADTTRVLTLAARDVRAKRVSVRRGMHISPNRHGQNRATEVLTGEIAFPALLDDLRLLLALSERAHMGRHTNEGLGAIALTPENAPS